MRTPYPNELTHYGILGMKWGVRRYQNPDGTLTEAGKKRDQRLRRVKTGAAIAGAGGLAVASGAAALKTAKKHPELFEQTIKAGKDKANVSPAEKVTKAAKSSVDSASEVVNAVGRIASRNAGDSEAKAMSDAELRQAISRMELERRYDSLTEQEKSKGIETVKDIFTIVGGVVGVAAGAATIYSTIKK